jgi:HSP20 family protein
MLSRYNVYRPLLPLWGVPASNLQSTMSRLFEDFETAFTRPAVTRAHRHPGPRAQLRNDGDSIRLLAELPGLRLEDIELSILGEKVTLKATPQTNPVPEGFTPLHRERQTAAVEWSFELPYPIDAVAASATLDQGLLSVSLPKAPAAKPRNIPIQAA